MRNSDEFIPRDEEARLAALHRLRILDTPPEPAYDRFMRLSQALFDAPLSGISLIDRDRQWLKAAVGVEERETPRSNSLCAHTILQPGPFVIADTLADERFRSKPCVTTAPNVRWYAGYPLRSPDGYPIGAFWVADTEPREGVNTTALGDFASLIEQQLGARDSRRQLHALNQSEEIFHHMAEVIQEVFWVASVDKSEILYINPAYAEVWGRSRESLYAEPASFLEGIHPDDLPRVLKAMERQIDGDYNEIFRVVRPDGSIRWLHDRAFPVKNEQGEVMQIVGAAHDITDERTMQLQLEQANTELQAVINNVPGIIYRCRYDDNWTMEMISDFVERLSGYPASDFIDNAVRSFASIIHPDDSAAVDAAVAQAIRDDQPYHLEYRLIHRDGSERWIYEYGQAVRDEHGQPAWLNGTILDIAERKLIEARQTAMQATIIQMQQAALAELSTPLIPITRGVVVMPLIGALDTHRAQQVLETLLDGATRNQARMAIIDITGVAVVDTHVAGVLVRAAQAVRLLGTQVAISGIRPEVAQTLVSLGTDLREMQTFSSLQHAIEAVLGQEQRVW